MIKLMACLYFALFALFSANSISLSADLTDGASQINCNYNLVRNQAEALLLIRHCYVDKIEQAVLDTAYKNGGFAAVFELLDPHSRYLDQEAAAKEDQSEKENSAFGGVGLEVRLIGKNLTVVGIAAGSPASGAGIREEDVIAAVCQSDDDCFAVNAKDLDPKEKNKFLTDIVFKIRGKIDSMVILKFRRKNDDKEIVVHLKRALIHIENVISKAYGEFGYVRLRNFSDNAFGDVANAISKFRVINGLVLDLRGNPGGYLSQAIGVSALFLQRKQLVATIVTRSDPRDRPQKYYPAFFQSIFGTSFNAPLVVLADEHSASASEIVAAACQDYKRCVVVGMPTFGKALVQTRHDFGKERMYLTTGRIYRPNGKSLQGKGVIPDIIVSNSEVETIENEMMLREQDSEKSLRGYLKGEEENLTEEEKSKFALLKKDRQLEMGLQILKILNLK